MLLEYLRLNQTSNICYFFAQLNDIIFNHKKSVCFKVGPLWSKSAPVLLLGNKDLQWVTSFYRAMHFSAKRGIAIACRLSVRPSVCDVGEL